MFRRGNYGLWGLIAVACIACAKTDDAIISKLSPIEREAHLVLTDQLERLDRGEDSTLLIMCTTITSERKSLPISAMLLEALDRAVPRTANLKFVDGTTCHKNNFGATLTSDGTRALNFFGLRHQDPETNEVIWRAGSTWETLWGGGEMYRIILKDGIPTAEVTGSWNT
jgi:hypothetical protein